MAAAAAAAAVSGSAPPPQTQNNVENLLDIDFDGTAPASSQKEPTSGLSGLEGLAGTPVRVASPSKMTPAATGSSNNNLDDLMGVFGDGGGDSNNGGGFGAPSGGSADLMNGFSGLDLSGPGDATAGADKGKKKNEDILDLF